jgi:hypothetical protein
MPHERVKPPGWTGDITQPRAAQLGLLDTKQLTLLDGAAGGTVVPTSALRIEGAGFGSDDLRTTTITGTLQRANTGRWERRVSTATILDQAAAQVLDCSYDVYRTTIDHANDIVIHLSMTTGQTPATNDIIEVIRVGVPSVPHSFQIYAESFPLVRVGAFIQVPAAGNQANQVYSARYFFNGTTWCPLRFSDDVSV